MTPQPSALGYAYVASAGPNPGSAGAIYEYALLNDSSVSPLNQASVGAGIYPAAVVVSQSRGHVYAVNVGDGTISQFNQASDGTLTPMNPATVTNPGMHTFGAAPAAAIIDPTGSFLYVTNAADNTLSQFSIASDGQLTPLTPASVPTGADPVAIAVAPVGGSTFKYYVLNSGTPGATGSVSLYSSSGADGTLTLLNSDTVAAGTNPSAIAVNNAFSTVYVMSNCDGSQCTGSIRQYDVGADGALTDTGVIATTGSHADAVNMAIIDNGGHTFAYVLGNMMGVDTNAGALWQYGVQMNGGLTAASPAMLNIGPVAVAQVIQVDSLYVLTTNSGVYANDPASTGGSIDLYTLGSSGAATPLATTKISAPYPAAMSVMFLLAP
jgi:6-phosphogluconolactonase (cycloisomerase 2 family)